MDRAVPPVWQVEVNVAAIRVAVEAVPDLAGSDPACGAALANVRMPRLYLSPRFQQHMPSKPHSI